MDKNGTITFKREESAALRRLRDAVEGQVITPADNDYEGARMAWNLTVQQFPSIIVIADSIADVQAAVEYANAENIKVAIQNTGHGIARCCDGGVLIRMARLNYVLVDEERQVAHIGGGARWSDVLHVAKDAGLAGLCGSAPHVGVVGYLMGGGYSLMIRKYGLAVDSVKSLQIVLADGSLVKASPTENEDLFWAVRGAGGGFGIVVEVEMQLYPHAELFGGAVLYPAACAADIYPKYLAWTKTLPEEVTSAISLMHFPPVPFIPQPLHNQSFVIINACVTDLERAEKLLRPIRELGTPVMDTFTKLPSSESGQIYRDPVDPLPAHVHGLLLRDLDDLSLTRFLHTIGEMGQSPNIKFEIRHIDGAMSRRDSSKSSMGGCYEAKYLLYVLGAPIPPRTPAAMGEQFRCVVEALGDQVLCEGPINMLGEGNVKASGIEGIFDSGTYARLREVKQRRDPENRFAFAGLGISS